MLLVELRDWYSDRKMDVIDYEEFKKYWPLAPEDILGRRKNTDPFDNRRR